MVFNGVLSRFKVVLACLLLSTLSISFISCGDDDKEKQSNEITGEWTVESSIDAGRRYQAVVFKINDQVFISTGYNANSNLLPLKDLWVYNSEIQTWQKKTDFPGEARRGAVAFIANGKAYVGMGSNGTTYYNDFYSYDPLTDEWAAVTSYPVEGRMGAIAFSIDNRGYVGTGHNNVVEFKDFYQYDPIANEWYIKPAVPKIERTGAFSFVINGKGYVGGGSNNGVMVTVADLYEYDPIAGTDGLGMWIEKNDLKDDKIDADENDAGYTIGAEQATTFVIGEKAYVVSGKIQTATGTVTTTQNWEYNPSTDTWKKMNDLESSARYGAIGYSIGNIGYIGTGITASGTYLNDLISFDPTLPDLKNPN